MMGKLSETYNEHDNNNLKAQQWSRRDRSVRSRSGSVVMAGSIGHGVHAAWSNVWQRLKPIVDRDRRPSDSWSTRAGRAGMYGIRDVSGWSGVISESVGVTPKWRRYGGKAAERLHT